MTQQHVYTSITTTIFKHFHKFKYHFDKELCMKELEIVFKTL